jgi:hypothetical protein
MNDVTAPHAQVAVRASDDEREQTVALLQRSFADGRLTLDELEDRVGIAYAARTRAQLSGLTADLPAAEQPPHPRVLLDTRLLCILLCICPPAGLAYWLLSVRQTPHLRAGLRKARPGLRKARPWQQLLAGAIVAGAGAALEILSHPAGAALVSAGAIVALPAMSRLLRRTWRAVRRTFPDARLAAAGDGSDRARSRILCR